MPNCKYKWLYTGFIILIANLPPVWQNLSIIFSIPMNNNWPSVQLIVPGVDASLTCTWASTAAGSLLANSVSTSLRMRVRRDWTLFSWRAEAAGQPLWAITPSGLITNVRIKTTAKILVYRSTSTAHHHIYVTSLESSNYKLECG